MASGRASGDEGPKITARLDRKLLYQLTAERA
jgi:hypothetical protein